MKTIALIGSTGSIGTQVLNVVRKHSDRFKVVSISAGNNSGLFLRQVEEFKPKVATIATQLNNEYQPPKGTQIFQGEDAFINAILPDVDLVVISIVGFKGLYAVLDAVKKGRNIALANKESLFVGGELVMKEIVKQGVKIAPIDSEHSAVWQALNFDFNADFKRIILTASGGAFRDLTDKQLDKVTAREALKHPNWQMGAKITIDCATLVNKAFEVTEARWLYNCPYEKIDAIIHRESIIHSMVELNDGAVMAQLSYPTMELPIALALSYPERLDVGLKSLDFPELKKLSFDKIDNARFPCFKFVVDCAKSGGVYPAIVNGANDRAVMLFLEGVIGYKDIFRAIEGAVNSYKGTQEMTLDNLTKANEYAIKYVDRKFRK